MCVTKFVDFNGPGEVAVCGREVGIGVRFVFDFTARLIDELSNRRRWTSFLVSPKRFQLTNVQNSAKSSWLKI